MKNEKYFLVKLEIPKGVSVAEMKKYIREAIGRWCKGGDPDEALFDLEAKTIVVKILE